MSRLALFLGIISRAVVSSTNFILRFHERNKLFVMIVNKMTPNLVPCGIPPLGVFHSDIMFSILKAWVLLHRKAIIQLTRKGGARACSLVPQSAINSSSDFNRIKILFNPKSSYRIKRVLIHMLSGHFLELITNGIFYGFLNIYKN